MFDDRLEVEMAAALAYPLPRRPRDQKGAATDGAPKLRLVEAREEMLRRERREARMPELATISYLTTIDPRPAVAFEIPRIRHAQPLSRSTVQQRRRVLRRRRLVASMVTTVSVLLGLWLFSGLLVANRSSGFVRLPGTVASGTGYLYTAQPGDTLWSIATRLDPTGDPRPVVDQLASELHGATLQAGMKLHLP